MADEGSLLLRNRNVFRVRCRVASLRYATGLVTNLNLPRIAVRCRLQRCARSDERPSHPVHDGRGVRAADASRAAVAATARVRARRVNSEALIGGSADLPMEAARQGAHNVNAGCLGRGETAVRDDCPGDGRSRSSRRCGLDVGVTRLTVPAWIDPVWPRSSAHRPLSADRTQKRSKEPRRMQRATSLPTSGAPPPRQN